MSKKTALICLGALLLAAAAALVLLLYRSSGQTQDTAADSTSSFVFSDSGITAAVDVTSGYEIEGTALTINSAGTYTISGSCSDGSITVKKGTSGVTLVLDGLSLTSGDTAPLSCNKSTGVTIVAAEGSVNTLTDSERNNDETYTDNENAENAVIKCKDGSCVTISGSGTLNITANGKNGIKSGATTDDEGTASLTILNVKLNIAAPVNDAINAEQLLNIESGTLNISAADDAIHSDYELNIGADGTIGPTITITDCYEAIEAATLNICSGNIDITSTDDCLNAANSDLTNYAFSMTISGGTISAYSSSGDGFDSNGSLTISGGTVVVWTANTADNQPLDADGTITISGGTVLAAGGSAGMGTNLNASQPCVIFGANGGMEGGMNRGPQGSASVSVSKGSTLSIHDTSGSIVYSADAPCNVSYALFSSAELTSGSSYTLYSGDTNAATATAQTGDSGSNGGMTPGASGPAAGNGNGDVPMPPDGSTNTPPSAPGGNQAGGGPNAATTNGTNATA